MKYILSLFLSLSLAGCGNEPGELELDGLTQGTSYHIKFVPAENTDASALHREIDTLLAKIDLQLSNYRDDSEASRFNQQQSTDWVTVSPALPELIAIAQTVHDKSQGCYDLTVKPLLEAWGFLKHEERMPSGEEIIAAKAKIGLHKIEADSNGGRLRKKEGAIQIDFSSIGQGYSVGQVADLLESRGITNYLLEIGGEMKVRGKKANGAHWRVAIEKPVPGGRHEMQRIIEVPTDRAVAIMTSGSYRNFFESGGKVYSHIISPSTGRPVDHHLLSVSVLHDDPTWADAWSTALLCLGEKEGPELAASEGLKAFFIYGENNALKEIVSPALSQEHFVNLAQ